MANEANVALFWERHWPVEAIAIEIADLTCEVIVHRGYVATLTRKVREAHANFRPFKPRTADVERYGVWGSYIIARYLAVRGLEDRATLNFANFFINLFYFRYVESR
jgi:hypothetical protein